MTTRCVEPIVLVMCPPAGLDTPPLGLAYLKAYLESQGRKVYAMDFNIEIYDRMDPKFHTNWRGIYMDLWTPKFFRKIGEPLTREIQWVVGRIMKHSPRVVGFSVSQSNLNFSFAIAKRLKAWNPHLVIIFGGPGVYWVDRSRNIPIGLLDVENELVVPMDLVDIIVHGEGEETLEACLKTLEEGGDLREVNAITTRVNGAYLTTGPHRPNRDVDTFPFPVFDWVRFEQYREQAGGALNPGVVPILLSRGCTNNCKFCNDFVMQGQYRYRNPESVFQEMRQRVVHEGFHRLYFCDLLLNGNLEQLRTLSEKLIQSGLPQRYGMMWHGQALARGDMDERTIHLMAQSGCYSITYGVESLSDKVLLAMRKNITVRDIESVLKHSHAAGMEVFINLIVGYPGEGEAEFEETIHNLKRYAKYITAVANLTMLTMVRGSPLFLANWRRDDPRLKLKADWGRCWVLEEYPDNTFEVRDRRFKRLQNVAQELGLSPRSDLHHEDAMTNAKEELSLRRTPWQKHKENGA